jgi:hypothetical protein
VKPWPDRVWPHYTDNCFPPAAQAKLAYERARADAAIERLRVAVEALNVLAAQDSGKPGSTARADCMAVTAKTALIAIGELPGEN